MLIGEGLPFIRDYIQLLNESLQKDSPESGLTRLQCYWLSFVIMGLLVTNSLCWKRFERYSVGNYRDSALSGFVRQGIPPLYFDGFILLSQLGIFQKNSSGLECWP